MLQEVWQEATTEAGITYWWHTVTRESRWVAPRLGASSLPRTEKKATGKSEGKKRNFNHILEAGISKADIGKQVSVEGYEVRYTAINHVCLV